MRYALLKVIKYYLIFLALIISCEVMAQQTLIEDFEKNPETRWKLITDSVMGGVSTGQLKFIVEDEVHFARMSGAVSTKNNGGFVQFRTSIRNGLPSDSKGLKLTVRGNSQKYFVHIRTRATFLPWQYYQASFEVQKDWSEVEVHLGQFKPSGALLPRLIKPEMIRSIAVVAFGRDHNAAIDVREVRFY